MSDDAKEQNYMIQVTITNKRTVHLNLFSRARNTRTYSREGQNCNLLGSLERKHDCGTSLKARGCERTNLHDIGHILQSTHCPNKDSSTREKQARRSKVGPKGPLLRILKILRPKTRMCRISKSTKMQSSKTHDI